MNQGIKNWSHEVEYAAIAVVILVLLSILVFPLFIVLLPIALLAGCSVVWRMDHMNKKM